MFLPHGFIIEQKISELVSLLSKPEGLVVLGCSRASPVTQRTRLCVLDLNLKMTRSVHSKADINITPLAIVAPHTMRGRLLLLHLFWMCRKNSYPTPQRRACQLNQKPISGQSSHPVCTHSELKLISPARPVFFCLFLCSATKCRRFIIQTSQGFV